MIEVKVPALGESIMSARVAKLLVAPGDSVKKDDNLCLLDTEKISLEVIAPENGVLTQWQVKEGDDVQVGGLLGIIDEHAIATADNKPKKAMEAPVATSPAKLDESAHNKKMKEASEDSLPSAAPTSLQSPAQLTPMPQVQTYHMPPHVTDERGEERVKMSKLREAIARRLKYSQNNAATLSTFNEVDMSSLIEMRQLHRERFQKEYGTKLGFMSFFVKAVCAALKSFPIVNAEISGNEVIYKNYYDIGIAVGSPTGLVVPVLKDADKKSFAVIEKAISEFGIKAEGGQLTLADLAGGTFTITNGGIFGSMLSTPILNPPQSAILGMHKIQERAVVKNGMIAIAPVMYLALSYDHRIIDGREAVSFLTEV